MMTIITWNELPPAHVHAGHANDGQEHDGQEQVGHRLPVIAGRLMKETKHMMRDTPDTMNTARRAHEYRRRKGVRE